MKNMIVRQVSAGESDVFVLLHTAHNPTRREWDDAMVLWSRYAVTGDLRRIRALVVSDGGGPDTSMRGELMAFFQTRKVSPKTAVVTMSIISRGIVAYVSWFNPHVKAFSPRHFPDALTHIDLPHSTQPRLLHELSEMQRELVPNSCLALITGASATATL